MTHAKKGWSYSTGERGRNRVRAFAHSKTGTLFLEFVDSGRRARLALGHRDREAAKAKAEELAAALRRGYEPQPAPTLAKLFDNYLREVTPQKGPSKQAHDRRAARLFLECFGRSQRIENLNRRLPGRAIGERVISYDLSYLRATLNWAVSAGWLDRNPLKGLPFPKGEAPKRPVLRHDEYEALRRVARQVHPLFELALILANETGHRIGAINALRWSDIEIEREQIRWRAATDKTGFEHASILTPTAAAALRRAREAEPAIGDAFLFAIDNGSGHPCSRYQLEKWLRKAEKLAGLKHQAGRGYHALRRKFATELKRVPLKDLCALGGWKDPSTVLTCYQTADETTMREALAQRRPYRTATESTH